MQGLRLNKVNLINSFIESRNCVHQIKDIRKRIIKGGSVQYVYQCLTCGKPTSSPITRVRAIEINGNCEPLFFDNEIKEKWDALYRQGIEEINTNTDKQWWDEYSKYLNSNEWKKKRLAVLNRANHLCEGCLNEKATEAHHTTYKHVGNELLFELVALCHSCHEIAHEEE